MTPRKPYPTDLSDDRWALLAPMLEAWRAERAARALPCAPPPEHDLREIVNAILYVSRTGMAWKYMPHDFPPHQTVYAYFADWEEDGTAQVIHDALRRKARVQAGRDPEPTAAIIDAQAVKASSNVPEDSQGYDAGKKTKGRKRHIAVDAMGLLLALVITAGSVQDTNGGKNVATALARACPTVIHGWVDNGYKTGFMEHAAAEGITFEHVSRPEGSKGFVLLQRRWVVERTFGWFILHRRLVRDYETLPERSASMIHWAMIDNMSRRLTDETTQSWHSEPAKTGEAAAA